MGNHCLQKNRHSGLLNGGAEFRPPTVGVPGFSAESDHFWRGTPPRLINMGLINAVSIKTNLMPARGALLEGQGLSGVPCGVHGFFLQGCLPFCKGRLSDAGLGEAMGYSVGILGDKSAEPSGGTCEES